MKSIKRTTHTIDAAGKTAGRLASQIAMILQGKNRPEYEPQWDLGDAVEVKNARAMVFTGNKLTDKEYKRHSGHPGGLKRETVRDVFQKNPGEVLRRAVLRMLPKNRLRTERMKRLTIE